MADRFIPQRMWFQYLDFNADTIRVSLHTGTPPAEVEIHPEINWTTGTAEVIHGWSIFDARIPEDDEWPNAENAAGQPEG